MFKEIKEKFNSKKSMGDALVLLKNKSSAIYFKDDFDFFLVNLLMNSLIKLVKVSDFFVTEICKGSQTHINSVGHPSMSPL